MLQFTGRKTTLIIPLLTGLAAVYLLGAPRVQAAWLVWTGLQATGAVPEQSNFGNPGYRSESRYAWPAELTLIRTVNDESSPAGRGYGYALSISQTVAITGNEVTGLIIEPITVFTTPITYYLYLPVISVSPLPDPGDCLTAEEFELVNLINQYRHANGLAGVPLSKSLTQVAQWHVIDLHENNPDSGSDHGLPCNMHSWSDKGIWSPVCYTSDHAYAAGMWNKPREITANIYTANGYENAYGSSGQATAVGAFNSWTSSPAHNAVILEQGIWSGSNWPAMGVGIYQHHAVLWFGDQADPQGTLTQICDVYN